MKFPLAANTARGEIDAVCAYKVRIFVEMRKKCDILTEKLETMAFKKLDFPPESGNVDTCVYSGVINGTPPPYNKATEGRTEWAVLNAKIKAISSDIHKLHTIPPPAK